MGNFNRREIFCSATKYNRSFHRIVCEIKPLSELGRWEQMDVKKNCCLRTNRGFFALVGKMKFGRFRIVLGARLTRWNLGGELFSVALQIFMQIHSSGDTINEMEPRREIVLGKKRHAPNIFFFFVRFPVSLRAILKFSLRKSVV